MYYSLIEKTTGMKKIAYIFVCALIFLLHSALACSASCEYSSFSYSGGVLSMVMEDGSEKNISRNIPIWAAEKSDAIRVFAFPLIPGKYGISKSCKPGLYVLTETDNELNKLLRVKKPERCKRVIFNTHDIRFLTVVYNKIGAGQTFVVYNIEKDKEEATLSGVGNAYWISNSQFAFTSIEKSISSQSRGEAHSVCIYELMGKDSYQYTLKEATMTEDYTIVGTDRGKGTITIKKRSVKSPKDWSNPQKIKTELISIPIPAVG